MTEQEKFDIAVQAFGEQREVLIVCEGIVYEGFVEYFINNVASAVVRIVTGEQKTTRFKRDFALAAIQDVAFIEKDEPEPVSELLPVQEMERLADNLRREAAQQSRLVPGHFTQDVLQRAVEGLHSGDSVRFTETITTGPAAPWTAPWTLWSNGSNGGV